ncbi:Lipopolysaccharide core biosynthesis glycosyl transferase lpsD [Granulibacter bethesdensis]|nr:Lipopolysaccharide core biosynthesis glycosyl transferase lpsD [Granulibacter bethesdensis]
MAQTGYGRCRDAGECMMRVAQIMAGAPQGGAELFFERLSIALHRSGVQVLPCIRTEPARATRLMKAGLKPVQMAFGGVFDVRTGLRLRSQLRAFAPQIAIAWMSRAARFAPSGDWALAGRLGGYYDLGYYRRCQHLIGNTVGLTRWMVQQGWPEDRVHYLPNFANDFSRIPAADRAEMKIPPHVPLVLALGRLHKNKGFDTLICALRHLPGVHALIAGEGPEREALTDLARKMGVEDRLHMPGWRSDTGALLAMADMLVCPSRHEPLGNVVIEGWSATCPVVATAADGPRELIQTGEDGLLSPIDDADALASTIATVLEDSALAHRLAASGRRRFERDYAEAPVLARWLDWLQRHAAPEKAGH